MCRTSDPIVLNGRRLGRVEALAEIRPALARPAVVAAGGVLLKAGLGEGMLWLGVEPNFQNGQRGYHYNLQLPDRVGPTLAGGVNANGSVDLLFDPASADAAGAGELRRLAAMLAALLIDAGLPGELPVGEVSRRGLAEVGAWQPPPRRLGDLVESG